MEIQLLCGKAPVTTDTKTEQLGNHGLREMAGRPVNFGNTIQYNTIQNTKYKIKYNTIQYNYLFES